MSFEPEVVKRNFPALQQEVDGQEMVYLDNAATSQKPQQVIDRIQEFYERENSNVGRGLYELANRSTRAYKEARKTVAEFVGADARELVFVRNTTEAVNLIAHSLNFEGDIVLADMAHHSEQLPWRENYSQDRVKYIPTDEDYKLDTEAAEDIIDENTGLVTVPHISNLFGTESDIQKLAEIAHENNAYIVVDGAQSVPNTSVDVKELDIDFLTFSGHKMLGPMGIGGLYGRKELLEEMDPYQVGGGMIRSVEKDEIKYGQPPEKFEAGTPNVAGAVGLAEAVKYLEKIGMSDIREHEKKLSKKIVEGLGSVEGVKVLASEGSSLVSFTTDCAHPHDVAEILDQNNVCVRAGHHCAQPQMTEMDVSGGTVRASPYIYNTEEDVEKLVEAVKEVREVFK